MGLAFIDDAVASGALREALDRERVREVPPVYRPTHGRVPAIVAAHGRDPELIGRVFELAATLGLDGPLAWPERELASAIAARLDQCRYVSARHVEFLRVAVGDDRLAAAVVDDPREVATTWPDPRQRAIAELAVAVTTEPWTLSRTHLTRAHSASLSDEEVLQVVVLTAFVGHLSRVAAAVDVPLDYDVKLAIPHPVTTTPPRPSAPGLVTGRHAIELARRPATHAALADWRDHAFYRDAPLSRRQRTLLARWVAAWLGDGGISPPTDLTFNPHDDRLRAFAEVVTLAPWQLADEHFTPLRDAGFDDEALFDTCATISAAGVFSRIEVALAALAI